MLLRLTLALAVVVGAAAAMKASQAAEDTPYIGVYEANVTDMEGYKANFLTPLQPKLDADIQERWTGKTTERVGKAPENRVVIGPARPSLTPSGTRARTSSRSARRRFLGRVSTR